MGSHAGEGSLFVAPVVVIRPEEPLAGLDGSGHADGDETFGLGVRKRPEEQRIDNAEDRRDGADTKGERDDAGCRETGVFREVTERVREVLAKAVEPDGDAHGTELLLDESGVSEMLAGLIGRGLVEFGAAGEVVFEFFAELGVGVLGGHGFVPFKARWLI